MSDNQKTSGIEIQAQLTLMIPVSSGYKTEQAVYDLSISQATVLGRSPDCQIPVDSDQYDTVSRQHAQIHLRAREPEPIWELCDLNSANGTFINGQKLQGCRDLLSGDHIVLSYDGPEFIFGCQYNKNTASPSKPETIEPAEIDSQAVPQSPPVTQKQEVIAKPEPKSVGGEEDPNQGIEEVAKQVTVKQVAVEEEHKPLSTPATKPGEPSLRPVQPEVVTPSAVPQQLPNATLTTNQQSLWDLAKADNIRTLSGHTNLVNSVAFSPDGEVIASGSNDKTVKLWNLARGEELISISEHKMPIIAVAFSPDGSLLATASRDKTVRLWDGKTGEDLEPLNSEKLAVTAISWSPDGQTLAIACQDQTIELWDVTTREQNTTVEVSSKIKAIAYSPDGSLLAMGGRDKTIQLRNLLTGETSLTLSGHKMAINAVCFSPDGSVLASASDDKLLKLWQLETGAEIRTLCGYSWQAGAVAISTDGQLFASGSQDHTLKIWTF